MSQGDDHVTMLRQVLRILPKRFQIKLKVFIERSHAETDDSFQLGSKFGRRHGHLFTSFHFDDVGVGRLAGIIYRSDAVIHVEIALLQRKRMCGFQAL